MKPRERCTYRFARRNEWRPYYQLTGHPWSPSFYGHTTLPVIRYENGTPAARYHARREKRLFGEIATLSFLPDACDSMEGLV